MPVHQYECKDCGQTFEIIGSFSMFVGLIPTCPKCKGSNIINKIFPALVVYKTNGFYKTDNEKKVQS